jgi:hypothetical protein
MQVKMTVCKRRAIFWTKLPVQKTTAAKQFVKIYGVAA